MARTIGYIDCPFWKKGRRREGCVILVDKICMVGECGFYPPTAEKRKQKLKSKNKGVNGQNEQVEGTANGAQADTAAGG